MKLWLTAHSTDHSGTSCKRSKAVQQQGRQIYIEMAATMSLCMAKFFLRTLNREFSLYHTKAFAKSQGGLQMDIKPQLQKQPCKHLEPASLGDMGPFGQQHFPTKQRLVLCNAYSM